MTSAALARSPSRPMAQARIRNSIKPAQFAKLLCLAADDRASTLERNWASTMLAERRESVTYAKVLQVISAAENTTRRALRAQKKLLMKLGQIMMEILSF